MKTFDVIDPWPHGGRYTYSAAVRKGPFLFISGVIARDPATGEITGKGDIVAQADFIYRKIEKILADAGGTFDDVVKTTDYITTLERYGETAAVRRTYFRNGFPAATGVVVKALVSPEALIEIDAIAIIEK
ncbi:MAG: Rid family hydrolase [Syntrophales bacterium]|jgi:enamine deaminase RidA (YjgF/YER057c/UK114 family)|nr:Rid family hydrolase [Syntrophales bacterium]